MLAPGDQRVMFVLPGRTHSIIGTTDTPTAADPDQVRATRADVEYLLDGANASFPEANLTASDVVCAWAGIRPLIAAGHAADPASTSREHAIVTGPRGVIAVTGGKLTTFRSMSAEVVDRVQASLGRRRTSSHTADRPLPGFAERPGGGGDDGALLVAGLPYTTHDVAAAADEEFACTVADVLVRRTHLALETRDHGQAVAPRVAQLLAPRFGWDGEGPERAVSEYLAETARLFTIDEAEPSPPPQDR
jgi:glycerol-3-phosphate dehydrogenase